MRARFARRRWRLLLDGPAPGDWNMALDAELFRTAIAGGPPTLRFYSWDPPAVSVGRFQDAAAGIDWRFCRRRGWHGVRRSTGGRAVLHHLELTYSIALPPDILGAEGLRGSYCVIKTALEGALESWVGVKDLTPGPSPASRGGTISTTGHAAGEGRAASVAATQRRPLFGLPSPADRPAPMIAPRGPAGEGPGVRSESSLPTPHRPPASCFARVAEGDIAAAGGKLVGSAQARSRGAMLQHGSILLDRDDAAWQSLFGAPGPLCALRDLTGRRPAPLALANYLAEDLAAQWGIDLDPEPPASEEHAAAEAAAPGYRLMECGGFFAVP